MNGSTENTAHDASEKSGRSERLVDLATARRMVPLVRQVVTDLLNLARRLAELRFEQERLDRQRRTLAWPERARRYQVQDEVLAAEQNLQHAATELENLGVILLDPDVGRVGFPTIVNDHRAFFSWKPGEDGVQFWHFLGENLRRAIPPAWAKAAANAVAGKS